MVVPFKKSQAAPAALALLAKGSLCCCSAVLFSDHLEKLEPLLHCCYSLTSREHISVLGKLKGCFITALHFRALSVSTPSALVSGPEAASGRSLPRVTLFPPVRRSKTPSPAFRFPLLPKPAPGRGPLPRPVCGRPGTVAGGADWCNGRTWGRPHALALAARRPPPLGLRAVRLGAHGAHRWTLNGARAAATSRGERSRLQEGERKAAVVRGPRWPQGGVEGLGCPPCAVRGLSRSRAAGAGKCTRGAVGKWAASQRLTPRRYLISHLAGARRPGDVGRGAGAGLGLAALLRAGRCCSARRGISRRHRPSPARIPVALLGEAFRVLKSDGKPDRKCKVFLLVFFSIMC